MITFPFVWRPKLAPSWLQLATIVSPTSFLHRQFCYCSLGHCDLRFVVGRCPIVRPLCGRFAAGNSPIATEILPARHPKSGRHFQGLPNWSCKSFKTQSRFLKLNVLIGLFPVFLYLSFLFNELPSGCWTSITPISPSTIRFWNGYLLAEHVPSWHTRRRSNSTTSTPKTTERWYDWKDFLCRSFFMCNDHVFWFDWQTGQR